MKLLQRKKIADVFVGLHSILLEVEQGTVCCLPAVSNADTMVECVKSIVFDTRLNTTESFLLLIQAIWNGEQYRTDRYILLFSLGYIFLISEDFSYAVLQVAIQRIFGGLPLPIANYLFVKTLPYATKEETLCRLEYFIKRQGNINEQKLFVTKIKNWYNQAPSDDEFENLSNTIDFEDSIVDIKLPFHNGNDKGIHFGMKPNPSVVQTKMPEEVTVLLDKLNKHHFSNFLKSEKSLSEAQINRLVCRMIDNDNAYIVAMLHHIGFFDYLYDRKNYKMGAVDTLLIGVLNVDERKAKEYRLCLNLNHPLSTNHQDCEKVRFWLKTIDVEYQAAISQVSDNQGLPNSA